MNEATNTNETKIETSKIHNIPKGGLQFCMTRHVKAFQFNADGTDDQWVIDQIDEVEMTVDGVEETAYFWKDAGETRIRPGQWIVFDPYLCTSFVVDDAYLRRISQPTDEEILGMISVVARDLKISMAAKRHVRQETAAAEERAETKASKKVIELKDPTKVKKEEPKVTKVFNDESAQVTSSETPQPAIEDAKEPKEDVVRPWTVIRNNRGQFLGNDMKWHKVPYPGCIFVKGEEVVLMKGKRPKAVAHGGRVITLGEFLRRPTVAQAIEGIVAWDQKYARTIPDREKTSWVFHGRKVSNLKHGTHEQMLRQLTERVQVQPGDSILIGSIGKVPYERIECGDSVEDFLKIFISRLKA